MTLPIVTTIGKPVGTYLAKKFGTAVIERWTKHRAEQFFTGFVEAVGEELRSGTESRAVDAALDALLEDQNRSEVLFDAYRRVCFSTSKNLGPRIIGLLTGEIVNEGRMANSIEDSVFKAAELLSDRELIEFFKKYGEYRKKAEGVLDTKQEFCMLGGCVIVRWLEENVFDDGLSNRDCEIGSFPWEEALGAWALKLHHAGLLNTRTQQSIRNLRNYGHDPYIQLTVLTTVTFEASCAELSRLLIRSMPPDTNENPLWRDRIGGMTDLP
jgi:hypothetical protein